MNPFTPPDDAARGDAAGHADEADRLGLSALMDGDAGAAEPVCLAWRDDAALRARWHAYHLIGDVLRSDDLAVCHGGEAFVERLRTELAGSGQEAALPTEQAGLLGREATRAPAANDAVFRWKLVAGLASFSAVAVLGWSALSGWGGPAGGSAQLAQAPVTVSAQAGASQVLTVAAPVQTVAAGAEGPSVMLRDPRLDALLAAHRQSSGVSALGNASGFLRSATFEGAGR